MQLPWKTEWRFLKRLKELCYEPAIALLGIYPKDTKIQIQKGTCTPMFIETLSTIAKLWQEPEGLSTDEWIKKKWYIYTMECYHAIKKNEILPFEMAWTEVECIMLSEVSQSEKDKIPYDFTHIYDLRNQIDEHRKKKKKREREANHKRLLNTENKLRIAEGEVGRGRG